MGRCCWIFHNFNRVDVPVIKLGGELGAYLKKFHWERQPKTAGKLPPSLLVKECP